VLASSPNNRNIFPGVYAMPWMGEWFHSLISFFSLQDYTGESHPEEQDHEFSPTAT
jgi:hypothetical protein